MSILRFIAFSSAIATVFCAVGAEFTIKDGVRDWTLAASYAENAVPSSGDVVKIPAGATAYLDDSQTYATSLALAKTLSRITPLSQTSRLEFTVDGEDEVVFPVSFSGYGLSGGCYTFGPLVKRGNGTLTFAAQNVEISEKEDFFGTYTSSVDYYAGVDVEAGTLKLTRDCTSQHLRLGYVTVAEGATVALATFTTAGGRVQFLGLAGAGTVAGVDDGTAGVEFYGPQNAVPADFSGRITGTLASMVISGHGQTISGAFDARITAAGNGAIQVNGLAMADISLGVMGNAQYGSTSLGYKSYQGNPMLSFSRAGGRIRYVGHGETVNRTFDCYQAWNNSGAYAVVLDGGPYGGLEFVGTVIRHYNEGGGQRFVLAGTNASPCVFNGVLGDAFASEIPTACGHNFYLTKEGSGTWRMAAVQTASGFTSGVSVDEGVLQYDSMAEYGRDSSLGGTTNWTDGVVGYTSKTAPKTNYALRLGGRTTSGEYKTSGRLEYTGSARFCVTNRPIAVAGEGGLRNNGAGTVRFAHVFGISENDVTLHLDGSSLTENEVSEISDGTAGGKLSVVKEGSGRWVLSGNQTFSGDLAVKGGELVIRDPAEYTWYRWVIRDNYGAATLDISEFALLGADGRYLTQKLYNGGDDPDVDYSDIDVSDANVKRPAIFATADPVLAQGEANAHLASSDNYNHASGLVKLFDNRGYEAGRWGVTVSPSPDDPSSWFVVTMRLPAGSPKVAGFDYANGTGGTGGGGSQCVSNYCIEASLDGLSWTNVYDVVGAGKNWNYCQWSKSGGTDNSYRRDVHGAYFALTNDVPAAAYPSMLENVRSVSVSGGGKLTLEAGARPVTIGSLKLTAGSGGTIDGFNFAANGTIAVEGQSGGAVSIPVSFVNCTDIARLKNWTVTMNGDGKRGCCVVVTPTGLEILPAGTMVIIR